MSVGPQSDTELEWRLFGAGSEWRARQAVSQDLPALATDALIVGLDSPTLRVLAGEGPDAFAYDLGELLERTLAELERWPATLADAWRGLVVFRCWEIATGRVALSVGARYVESVTYAQPGQPDDADGVVLDFSGYDDELIGGWGRDTDIVEREIATEARAVVRRFLNGQPIDGS